MPPVERVAVFDNDGTLWCEKPMPVEVGFILKRFAEMAKDDPSLARSSRGRRRWSGTTPGSVALMTKHYHGDDTDVKLLMAGIIQAFAASTSMSTRLRPTPTSTAASTRHWVPFHHVGFVPMIELLGYLSSQRVRELHRLGWGSRFHATDHRGDVRDPVRADHRQLNRAALSR